MPRLSQEKINEIRQSVDIVEVIGNYLPLERKGRNYIALCPFHNDSHPSMSVSPEKQIFMCFVCHHGGNVFTFLKDTRIFKNFLFRSGKDGCTNGKCRFR